MTEPVTTRDAPTMPPLEPELESALQFRWQDFPTLTASLEGSGGVIRQELADFCVTERPLYLPSGSGNHRYLWIEKRGLTTRDLVTCLMQAGVEERAIGVAGLKDKHAITRQWLSLPKKHSEAVTQLAQHEGVRILEESYHSNKLGIGHLLGNHFHIRVRQCPPGGYAKAQAIVAVLQARGVPNYFGAQRFGRFGNNARDGYRLLQGEWVPGGHQLKRFFVSALQSLVFNLILRERLELGYYDRIIHGDWAKKHDTGGIFRVQDPEQETVRARSLAISATIPLYGKKVRLSEGEAGEIEQRALESLGLRWSSFANHKLAGRRGDRRISRVVIEDVELSPTEDGYCFGFSLRKGAFATTVLRELMKVEVDSTDSAPSVSSA